MTTTELLRLRLYNQLLAGHSLTQPKEIVAWMGAMQAQNYEMAKWAVGVRLPGSTNAAVEAAISRGDIVRTHILRPTWHLVAPEDIRWMLELTAPRIKKAFVSYAGYRGMDEAYVRRGMERLPGILEEHGHLTREEIGEHLTRGGFKLENERTVHYIVSFAELDGLVCSGEVRDKKQTYALLHLRTPDAGPVSKEEALARLARRFFSSHGPAMIEDYSWWSGLNLTEARQGIEQIKQDFVCERINGKDFWMSADIQIPPAGEPSVLLLPAFDEFVVSYKNREEVISETHHRKVLTLNGIFSPTVHVDGEIVGTWKRVTKKGRVTAVGAALESARLPEVDLFDARVGGYERFNTLS